MLLDLVRKLCLASQTPLLDRNWPRPRKLEKKDSVDAFNCGRVELDDWLARFALINQQASMTNVFVCEISGEIVAYYALSAGQVKHESASMRITKGVANHPIPVVILTRFAVDVRYQGMGLGRAMLRDLLIRVSQVAAEEIGIRALLIHAKDGVAKAYYLEQAEFEQSPTDPLHLLLLMKDLRKAIH